MIQHLPWPRCAGTHYISKQSMGFYDKKTYNSQPISAMLILNAPDFLALALLACVPPAIGGFFP